MNTPLHRWNDAALRLKAAHTGFDAVENEDILDLQTKVAREVTRRLEPELARAETGSDRA